MIERLLKLFGLARVSGTAQAPGNRELLVQISSRLADLNEQISVVEVRMAELDEEERELQDSDDPVGDYRWDWLASRRSQYERQIDVVSNNIVSLEEQRTAIQIAVSSESVLPHDMVMQIQQRIQQAEITIEQTAVMTDLLHDDTTDIADRSREQRQRYGESSRKQHSTGELRRPERQVEPKRSREQPDAEAERNY